MLSLLAPFHLIFIHLCESVTYSTTNHRVVPVVSSELHVHVLRLEHTVSHSELFLPIHPVNVILVVCLELLALEFERVSDQACLRCPGIGTQMDLPRDLKALKFRWSGKSRITSVSDGYGEAQ